MSEFTLYFNAGSSITVTVEADDLEDAIEDAVAELPSSICAHCSGMGQVWSRDEGSYEFDEDGYVLDGEYIDTKATT